MNTGEIILYQPDDIIRLEVRIEDETVWLTQMQMAELFQTTIPNINFHLKNIYEEEELEEVSTIKDFLIVRQEGKRHVQRSISFYNLDAIISVGYRIRSRSATQFRKWATKVLREYILNGIVVNQRIDRVENFVIETVQRLSVAENEIEKLKCYLETVLFDYNDINEDTRIQLELINETLAKLQVINKKQSEPMPQIGFCAPQYHIQETNSDD